MGAVRIGISGWRYPPWRGVFYPHGLAQARDVTADFVYIRLHGEQDLYASGYDDAALERWAGKIREWARGGDVYCYFDNDIKVRAPFDALRLIDMTS